MQNNAPESCLWERVWDMTPGGADVTPPTGVPFSRGLYVGTTGNVAVVTHGGDTVTFPTVPAGGYIKAAVAKVLLAGTTAAGIRGGY